MLLTFATKKDDTSIGNKTHNPLEWLPYASVPISFLARVWKDNLMIEISIEEFDYRRSCEIRFSLGTLTPHLVHKNKWVGFVVTNITTLNFSFLTAHGISFVISLIITLVNPWNCRSTEDTSMTSKIQITLGWKQRQCISMTTRGKCWVTSNLRYMQMIQDWSNRNFSLFRIGFILPLGLKVRKRRLIDTYNLLFTRESQRFTITTLILFL